MRYSGRGFSWRSRRNSKMQMHTRSRRGIFCWNRCRDGQVCAEKKSKAWIREVRSSQVKAPASRMLTPLGYATSGSLSAQLVHSNLKADRHCLSSFLTRASRCGF